MGRPRHVRTDQVGLPGLHCDRARNEQGESLLHCVGRRPSACWGVVDCDGSAGLSRSKSGEFVRRVLIRRAGDRSGRVTVWSEQGPSFGPGPAASPRARFDLLPAHSRGDAALCESASFFQRYRTAKTEGGCSERTGASGGRSSRLFWGKNELMVPSEDPASLSSDAALDAQHSRVRVCTVRCPDADS